MHHTCLHTFCSHADKDGYGKENGAILSKIENMTGSRIMVAPYDPLVRRAHGHAAPYTHVKLTRAH
eukprot:14046-Eustigmatos_ZCMA.PRE.1